MTDTYLTDNKPCLLYYRSIQRSVEPGIIEKLQDEVGISIDVCDSWQSMMTRLSVTAELKLPIPIILIDKHMFIQKDATVSEIIDMLSTLHRCLSVPVKMRLAVVVEADCDPIILKQLRDYDVIGIVPCAEIYGCEKTIESLKNIVSGKTYWPKEIIDLVTRHIVIKASPKLGIILTSRQTQVLSLVCNRGLSNKKIAQALKISESTVKVHISAILKEYGVQNRTQLALAANSSLSAGITTGV